MEEKIPGITMLDEIRQQPQAIGRLIEHELQPVWAMAERWHKEPPRFIMIAARGTSDHAGLYGKYLFETKNGIPVGLAAPSIASVYQAKVNLTGGLVIGTGDLSEIALGWSTFNGDHISMYSVNCGVPKTLVRHLIEYYASVTTSPELARLLLDVNATPVSPELLPGVQHTEDILGNYELHDFFLYYFLKYGENPNGLLALAMQAFKDDYEEEAIRRTLDIFVKRFFSQQFKRNAMPDGPKIGTIALSPRGDWRMPADADAAAWLTQQAKHIR